ncbi:MAG: TolB family protein [Planctomycetota bacterium]
MRTKKRTVMGIILGVAAGLALCAGLALAKKGGKPPPEPALDSGTIYFLPGLTGTVHEMDPDGTNVTALSSKLYAGDWDFAEPSKALHGGERWFLQAMPILGETYPNDLARHELFAVNASGTIEVQLTDDAAVEPIMLLHNSGVVERLVFPRWAKDGTVEDGKASYVARRWVELTDGTFEVQDLGIYVVDVDPDSLVASGYTAQVPTYIELTVDTGSSKSYGAFAMCLHEWSPDGTSLIYGRGDPNKGLWRADASDGFANPVRLTTDVARNPRWSPNGDLIVFQNRGIQTIKPDGTGQTVVMANPAAKGQKRFWLQMPRWSPNGTHLIYAYTVEVWKSHGNPSYTTDLYRAVADGTYQTNLTEASDDYCWPIGWRD